MAHRVWPARPLVTEFGSAWSFLDGIGGQLWFATNCDAPLYQVLSIGLNSANAEW